MIFGKTERDSKGCVDLVDFPFGFGFVLAALTDFRIDSVVYQFGNLLEKDPLLVHMAPRNYDRSL